MKCQNCGKNEVNFHYSSNVNGCVTETNLCSECAEGAGYDMNALLNKGGMFSELFSVFGGGGLLPAAMPGLAMISPSTAFPRIMRIRMGPAEMYAPQMFSTAQIPACGCGCQSPPASTGDVKTDEAMTKRRELNMQMRKAVENEDFEKAAELRDKIKELNT